MGSIRYDGVVVVMDDRTLTHLQIVIVNKLRKGETFLMSWRDAADVSSGRGSIWLHPYVLVYFKFDGGRVPVINDEWLRVLAASADSSRGLIVTAEDGDMSALPVASDVPGSVRIIAPGDRPKPRAPRLAPRRSA